METVQRTVRACEAANFKRFSGANAPGSMSIRWRRKSRKFAREMFD